MAGQVSRYICTLPYKDRERYKKKLDLIEAAIHPYDLPNDNWKNDVTLWPPLKFGQIYI
jgi:phage-related protein